MDETLDLQGAADFLKLGLDATRELIKSGAVPALRITQKHTVVLRSALVDYVRTEGARQADVRRANRTPRKVKRVAPSSGGAVDLARYELGP